MSEDTEIALPIPMGWLEAIAEGEADLLAGRTIPAEAALAELRQSSDRMIARHEGVVRTA